MKTFAEQVAGLKATREEKDTAMRAVAQKSVDEGRSMDTAESEQFDTLVSEIKRLDADISRLSVIAESDKASAKAVDTSASDRPAGTQPKASVQVKNTEKLDPGIAMARLARCHGLGFKMHRNPADIAKSLYPQDDRLNSFMQKAAVPAANTLDSGWAGFMVDDGGLVADFVEFLRPMTILGKFGQGGVPNLRRVPFRTRLLSQTSGGAGYWVGEGKAKPLTSFAGAEQSLSPLKVANIAVATMELLRDSSPSADAWIRDQLVAALRERLDIDFIDPAKTASANLSPASILNGANAIASSGTDADAVRADMQALFRYFIGFSNPPTQGVWIMDAINALSLGLMQNPLGQSEFPGLGMNGGTLFGLPVIVSEYVPRDTAGGIVALVNASDIYLADEGGFEVAASDQASLEMDTAPTNASAPSGAVTETTLVSMWQTNSVAFRAERTINWARRRAGSVAYLTGVNWGA